MTASVVTASVVSASVSVVGIQSIPKQSHHTWVHGSSSPSTSNRFLAACQDLLCSSHVALTAAEDDRVDRDGTHSVAVRPSCDYGLFPNQSLVASHLWSASVTSNRPTHSTGAGHLLQVGKVWVARRAPIDPPAPPQIRAPLNPNEVQARGTSCPPDSLRSAMCRLPECVMQCFAHRWFPHRVLASRTASAAE